MGLQRTAQCFKLCGSLLRSNVHHNFSARARLHLDVFAFVMLRLYSRFLDTVHCQVDGSMQCIALCARRNGQL